MRPLFPERLAGSFAHDTPERLRLVEKSGLKDHAQNVPVPYYAIVPPGESRVMKFITANLLNPENPPRIERMEAVNAHGVRISRGSRSTEIWLNLLDNAAKFSPENGTISVTLHCEQGRPVVAVTDQGCGMDAETCCHIFEQFYQGDTSHRTQGNGLGLAMAQKIAALHGGAVTVDSRPGSGSCFTVVLQ